MPKKTSRIEGIKGIIDKVIKKIEKNGSGKKESIFNAWKKVCGDKASLHSRPISIRRKALIVEVDSSTWLYDLTLKKRVLLKDIKRELGEDKLKDIRFRMGDIT